MDIWWLGGGAMVHQAVLQHYPVSTYFLKAPQAGTQCRGTTLAARKISLNSMTRIVCGIHAV